MRTIASLAVPLWALALTCPALAQIGNMGTYGTGFGGGGFGGRSMSDGPDLFGSTYDVRDDDETWNSRFVTDLMWEQALSDRPTTGPLRLGDVVIVGFVGRSLKAYRYEDGSTLWSVDLPGDIAGQPQVGPKGSDVVLTTQQGDAIRLRSSDGQVLFRAHLAQEIRTPPAVHGDGIVVASRDDVVFGLDGETGAVRWRTPTGGKALTQPIIAGREGLALLGDEVGVLWALSLRDGQARYRYETKGSILAPPAASSSMAFVASSDHYLHAVDLDDGSRRWRHRLGAAAFAPPVVATLDDENDELIIVATLDNVLQAFRVRSGFRAWKVKLPRRVVASLQAVGPAVYATPFATGEVLGFMTKNGYALGRATIESGDDYGVGRAEATDKSILVASYGRRLTRFKTITSKQVEDGEEQLPERVAREAMETSETKKPETPPMTSTPLGSGAKKKGNP